MSSSSSPMCSPGEIVEVDTAASFKDAGKYLYQIVAERLRWPTQIPQYVGHLVRDKQVKQFAGCERTGYVLLLAMQNRNKPRSDPDRCFTIRIHLQPQEMPEELKDTMVDVYAYFGKHFDCINHINCNDTWSDYCTITRLEELLWDLEGKEWA